MDSIPSPLQKILQFSQQMLQLAEAEEWEELVELEAERRQLIAATFPLTAKQAAIPSTVTDLEQIIELDHQLMGLCSKARRKIGSVLGKINKGRQATTAYRKVAG
jgi:hypothetical protein